MKLVFGSRPTLGSWLLRFFTFSRWSHVGIVYGDEVVEATYPRVRSIPLKDWLDEYPTNEFGEFPCANELLALQFAQAQIGKLYDWGGCIAFPFQVRDWQSNNRFFCSELPIVAAQTAGTDVFRDAHRVTPEMLYEVTSPEK